MLTGEKLTSQMFYLHSGMCNKKSLTLTSGKPTDILLRNNIRMRHSAHMYGFC